MFIYLHIPFCASHCIYCDFYVVLEKYGGQDAYVDAVVREIELRFSGREGTLAPIRTLYVGGGTPSLLTARQYDTLFSALKRVTPFKEDAEITFEANPAHMRDDPEAYRAVGFNRVSVGIQSFNDPELKKLSRMHTARQAEETISHLQNSGFDNISIDLMYGIPGQTLASWDRTLDRVMALGVSHVSMYGLKVEETTPLHRLVGYEAYALPEDEETVEMYYRAVDRLESGGFELYEFSNLARPGRASRHNLNYWDNGEFYGLGVSAHGYLEGARQENVREIASYLAHPLRETKNIPYTETEKLENALMLGLRKSEGVDIRALESRYRFDFEQKFGRILRKYEPEGYLIRDGNQLRLSRKAIPVSNALLAEFF